MNEITKWTLLIQDAATLFMVGLIWFVQIVHYPLFSRVGEEAFQRYETDHQRLTTWVVGPPMLAEFATAILLVWCRPSGIGAGPEASPPPSTQPAHGRTVDRDARTRAIRGALPGLGLASARCGRERRSVGDETRCTCARRIDAIERVA